MCTAKEAFVYLDELLSRDHIVHVLIKLAEHVANSHEASSHTLQQLGVAKRSDLRTHTVNALDIRINARPLSENYR